MRNEPLPIENPYYAPLLRALGHAEIEFGKGCPTTELSNLHSAAVRLEQTTREAVAAARREGTSWATIAAALGMRSKQAAQQRYGR